MSKPEKILAQELLELEVLDLAAGETVGSVLDFALDRNGVVTLIGILPQRWYKGGVGMPPAAIASLNQQRICIADGAGLAAFAPDGETTFSAYADDQILGKLVLQEEGELLGELVDFAFSLEDGRILDLVVQDASEKRVRVPVESFKTIGREYIIVQRGNASAVAPAPAAQPAIAAPAAAPEAPVEPAPAQMEASAPMAAPEAEAAPESAPVEPEPAPAPASRAEEKDALFNAPQEAAELTKFDQKKRDFLRGRKAHRDLADADGAKIVAKGHALTDAVLERIIAAGMLGDVFIEMTLNK